MIMTLQNFITLWTGCTCSFPYCQDNECPTLVHRYITEVLGVYDPTVLAQPYAFMDWTNFANVPGSKYFEQIANTPINYPSPGDIVIFGANATLGIPQGHMSICVTATEMALTTFDVNFPTGSLPHLQAHNYDDLQQTGWLRFKT